MKRQTVGVAVAFLVALLLVNPGCASRVVNVGLFTLAQILEMRRSLDAAEAEAVDRSAESARATTRAAAARRRAEEARLARSANAGRFSADAVAAEEAAAAVARTSAEAAAALNALKTQLAGRLRLEGVTNAALGDAIRDRLAELELTAE